MRPAIIFLVLVLAALVPPAALHAQDAAPEGYLPAVILGPAEPSTPFFYDPGDICERPSSYIVMDWFVTVSTQARVVSVVYHIDQYCLDESGVRYLIEAIITETY